MDADAVTRATARMGALRSVLTRDAWVGGMDLSYANTTDAFGFVKLTPRYCGVLPSGSRPPTRHPLDAQNALRRGVEGRQVAGIALNRAVGSVLKVYAMYVR